MRESPQLLVLASRGLFLYTRDDLCNQVPPPRQTLYRFVSLSSPSAGTRISSVEEFRRAWSGKRKFIISGYLLFQMLTLPWVATGGSVPLWEHLAIVSVAVLLQAFFLFGGGRIDRTRGSVKKSLVAVALFALGMCILARGAVLVLADFSNASAHLEWFSAALERTTLAVWVLWFIIGLLIALRVDRRHALGILAGALFFGSWAEFVAAVSVQLMIGRVRVVNCACAYGSLMALLLCLPLLIIAMGPALVLLLIHEHELLSLSERFAAKTVMRFFRRGKVPEGGTR